ncbi:MAG TPA: alanyl-tRNA editing protein [Candidatus Nanoarchaeia archaeon]|nr:alanyl-tRNA editing protein [Candidatus Nanoarchaeia archaeon]
MDARYLHDAYQKEFAAKVIAVDGNFAYLDQTYFYPEGGGQPHDTGVLQRGNERFPVVFTTRMSGKIAHQLSITGLQPGDSIRGMIDWNRRYALMRMHTAAHILSEVFHRQAGALITGNQLDVTASRIDFSLESFTREAVAAYVAQANDVVRQDLPVTIRFLPREEAMKLPQVSKLAMGLPQGIAEVRIVSIGGFDQQADGGTHVRSTKEIGAILLDKIENKGKANRRIYFSLGGC